MERGLDGGGDELRGFRVDDDVPAEQRAADDLSGALLLAAASIATRRPGGALSPRSINTIIGEIGRLHDLQVDDPERQLDTLRLMICAIPSPIGSLRPPAITAPNSNAASATPTTAT